MYNLLLSSLVFTLGSVFYACSAPRTLEKSKKGVYIEASANAQSMFDKSPEILPNSDSTYFLFRLVHDVVTEFLVMDDKKNILLDKQHVKGIVKWHSSHALSITRYPGALEDRRSDPSDYIEIIDLNETH